MTSIRVEINSSWEDDNLPFLSIPNSTNIVNVRCFIYRNKLAEETVVNSAAILGLRPCGGMLQNVDCGRATARDRPYYRRMNRLARPVYSRGGACPHKRELKRKGRGPCGRVQGRT